ncbi:MAG: hypothetical protein JNK04_09710 [Myxococcales bacterium]|nr:hypothetical protein [Myxococcales bacterium]
MKLAYEFGVAGNSYTGTNVNVDGTGGRLVDSGYPRRRTYALRDDPADPSIAGVKLELEGEMKPGWLVYLTARS